MNLFPSCCKKPSIHIAQVQPASIKPELQLKMLQALGLQSTLITDGSNPINLFNTANGLVGALAPKKAKKENAEDVD